MSMQTGERSLLKNLGNWLGHLTIKQDKIIRHKDLDLKSLLYEAYEQGRMIAVLPFINRILEHCKESKVFKPSNPWVQSILCLAAEIYALDNLKLNLKFEIETMFRSQNDMKPSDVTASNTLSSHKRETVNNQDFGADKAPASPAQPPPPPAGPPAPSPGVPATPPKPEPDSKAPAGLLPPLTCPLLCEECCTLPASQSCSQQLEVSSLLCAIHRSHEPVVHHKSATLLQHAELIGDCTADCRSARSCGPGSVC